MLTLKGSSISALTAEFSTAGLDTSTDLSSSFTYSSKDEVVSESEWSKEEIF
jgi:hypothetical protein